MRETVHAILSFRYYCRNYFFCFPVNFWGGRRTRLVVWIHFLPRGFKRSVRRGKMLYDVLRQVNCRSWHPWHHFLVPSTSHCEIRPDWRGQYLKGQSQSSWSLSWNSWWENNFLTFGETNASLPYFLLLQTLSWTHCNPEAIEQARVSHLLS